GRADPDGALYDRPGRPRPPARRRTHRRGTPRRTDQPRQPARLSALSTPTDYSPRRSGGRLDAKTRQQRPHTLVHVAHDAPNGVDVLAPGVVELPVLVALSVEDRAGLTTAHGDHDVGAADALDGQQPGALTLAGQSALVKRLDDSGVQGVSGRGPRGPALAGTPAVVPGKDLGGQAAAAVMDAGEQDDGPGHDEVSGVVSEGRVHLRDAASDLSGVRVEDDDGADGHGAAGSEHEQMDRAQVLLPCRSSSLLLL